MPTHPVFHTTLPYAGRARVTERFFYSLKATVHSTVAFLINDMIYAGCFRCFCSSMATVTMSPSTLMIFWIEPKNASAKIAIEIS